MLFCYCSARSKTVWLARRALFQVGVVGVLLLTGGNLVVIWAERYVTSSLAALIVALVPIWVAILDAYIIRRLSNGSLEVQGVAL